MSIYSIQSGIQENDLREPYAGKEGPDCACAVWSGPSLPAYRIKGYCCLYWLTEKALVSACMRRLIDALAVIIYIKRAIFLHCPFILVTYYCPSDKQEALQHMTTSNIQIRLLVYGVWLETSLFAMLQNLTAESEILTRLCNFARSLHFFHFTYCGEGPFSTL